LSYDQAKNEKERKEALERLKKWCIWEDPTNYTKPTNMKKVAAGEGGDMPQNSTDDEEEDEELKKYSSHFQYDEVFNKRVFIDELIEYNKAECIHPVSNGILMISSIAVLPQGRLWKDDTQGRR
jgi:hypothetical protein